MNLDNIDKFYDMNMDEYKEFLSTYPQYNLEEVKELLKYDISSIISECRNTKTNYLYKSFTHGVNHNYKTILFAYIICKLNNIDSGDYKIIMDACKYHDIGRIDDEEDPSHGTRSSQMVENVVKDDLFYKTGNNLDYLKAIIEVHSHSDSDNKMYFENYKLDDYDRYVKLYSVLKDADGLDRVRISYICPDINWLDPKYLRTESAKKFIKFAYEVNDVWVKIVSTLS